MVATKIKLVGMMNLAISLRSQGKNTQAEAIQQQTLQLQETVLEDDDPDTIMSMS